MAKKLLALVTLTVAASAIALLLAGPTVPAGAQAEEKAARGACNNPGFYTGTDSTGDFQAALEDAISNAETCAGCCDQRVSYEVVQTQGQRGGFVFLNDIDVTIEASW